MIHFQKRKRLGEILLDAKVINDTQLNEALRYQREKGGKLGEALIELNILSEGVLNNALSQQLHYEIIHLADVEINQEILDIVGEQTIRQHKAVPFYMDDHEIRVAVTNPLDIELEDKIYDLSDGRMVKFYLSTRHEIDTVISRYLDKNSEAEALSSLETELYGKEKIDINEESNNLIINISNQFFRDASLIGASDIHINPQEDKTVVKFRIDGVLQTYREFPKQVHNPLVIRIKNSAGLDFTKTGVPQDGRTTITVQGGKTIDLRIATLPTTNGEKITIRLLDKTALNLDLSKIGLMGTSYNNFINLLKRKSGIILITGETGSGKSSLCYAMLNSLNDGKRNILTVEDPVEYELEGISQVNINEKAGLTFASALRSFLRNDPNIILVGEIRDLETVQIAVQSSITGHLVFSTIHTNSSALTITRLEDMGVERHKIAESVIGIINQRLVPTICPACKQAYKWTVTDDFKKQFNIQDEIIVLYQGTGKNKNGHTCDVCHGTGKKGRMAVQELLPIDEAIGELIKQKASRFNIEQKAREIGFIDYKEDGWNKTRAGFIPLDVMKGDILYA